MTKDKQARDEALKPCPFCGGDARIDNTHMTKCFDRPAGRLYWAVCETCDDVCGNNSDSFKEAIAAWNTRAAQDVEAVDVGNHLEGLHSEMQM